VSATVGGCREITCSLLPVVDVVEVASAVIKTSAALAIALLSWSASPLGYPRVATPTWRESADPELPCPPTEGWPPSGSSWGWVVTGPATSADIDPDSLVDTNLQSYWYNRSRGGRCHRGRVALFYIFRLHFAPSLSSSIVSCHTNS